jgi:catechol 2,3-dioxygenase-like lactoylglutathione lyase family enzyme
MITVQDVTWVRIAAPDLDLMETFLEDFGMLRAARTATRLYMRGRGGEPFVHVTELGDPRPIGFGLRAGSALDLAALARKFNTSVQPRTEPGGGDEVVIQDPDGNRIEVVCGLAGSNHASSRAPFKFNPAADRARPGGTIRVKTAPSQVQRLGHVMLRTAQFDVLRAFYTGMFGMRISDNYYMGTADNTIASFLHCGLKQQLVDHHTIAIVGDGHTGFEHIAFEVLDLDDLMSGNRHLMAQNRWKHSWGVGRHIEGSQIFDYWRDPFGNKIEHWTDGDLVNDEYVAGNVEFNPMQCLAQWGPPPTADFMGQNSPPQESR